ncbi:tetratricopeptide repeat protein, partial [Escherichia coli]|nr:tetratricopeptide repeat protein [Escherichia coli]
DRVNLAQTLLKTSDFASAEPLIEAARREAPDDANALIAAAHLHDRRNQLTDALALAERATALAPSLGTAWSARGYALLRMKRFPEAI